MRARRVTPAQPNRIDQPSKTGPSRLPSSPDPRGGLRQEVVVAPELVETELVDVVADGHQLRPGHVLAPDLEPEAEALWGHRQTSDTLTTVPVRADSSAASMIRNPRTESSGSTGRSPTPRTASRKPS